MKMFAFFDTQWRAADALAWSRLRQAKPASRRHFPLNQPSSLGCYDVTQPAQLAPVVAMARAAGLDGFVIDCQREAGAYRHDAALLAPFCDAGFGLAVRWRNQAEHIWSQLGDVAGWESRAGALAEALAAVPRQPLGGGLALIVDAPKQFVAAAAITRLLRQAAERAGLPGLMLIANRAEDKGRFLDQGFDALIDPPPDEWHACKPSNQATGLDFLEVLAGLRDSTDYLDQYFAYLSFTVARMLNRSERGRVLPRVFPAFHDWLLHPDGGATLLVAPGNKPADAHLFGLFVENAMLFTERHFPLDQQAVFLHSWNFWLDGSQVEPSLLDGDLLYTATRQAIDRGRYMIRSRGGAAPDLDDPRRRQIDLMVEAARQTLNQS